MIVSLETFPQCRSWMEHFNHFFSPWMVFVNSFFITIVLSIHFIHTSIHYSSDPDTPENEIDCSGKLALGGRGTGEPGNKCHYDCSGRGTCDYSTGTCHCFESFYGSACELRQSRRNS